jgi:hypothetical protein
MSEHAALQPYERGTTRFLGETGHWHAVWSPHGEHTGRQWVRGRVEACPIVKAARLVRPRTTPFTPQEA